MIISFFGKKFLNYYNSIEKKKYTPKDFFVKVMHPIFFGGDKMLMHVQNSPFNNTSYRGKTVEEKLHIFFDKIEKKEFDSCMLVGGYASDLTKTTTFNISWDYENFKEINEDEIYYSWIGEGLKIHMGGGINYLFNDEEILYDIHRGWEKYSELLNSPEYEKVKQCQIGSWNNLWLSNLYLNGGEEFNPFNNIETDKIGAKLTSINWLRFFYILSSIRGDDFITAYAYGLGQKSKTYGNITIQTNKFKSFFDFCNAFFNENDHIKNLGFYEKAFGENNRIYKISENGNLGFFTIKPSIFDLYGSNYQKEIKKYVKENNLFKLIKLYIMYTLNENEIENDLTAFADLLIYFKGHNDTKSAGNRVISEMFKGKGRQNTLKCIAELWSYKNLFSEEQINALNKFESLVKKHKNKNKYILILLEIEYNKNS